MLLQVACNCGFRLLQSLLNAIDAILKITLRRTLRGGALADETRAATDFHSSAHSLRVIARCGEPITESVRLSHFLYLHGGYGDPIDMILRDRNASLMNVDGPHALFAVLPAGFDAYDSSHGPFLYSVQFRNCRRVVRISTKNLVALAERLPPPSQRARPVVLFHTGRCGSTLLVRMAAAAARPAVIGLSEPEFVHRVEAGSFVDRASLLEACVALQCKDFAPGRIVLLKPRSLAVRHIREMARASSSVVSRADGDSKVGMKLLFMYRDPVETVGSLVAGFARLRRGALRPLLAGWSRLFLRMLRFPEIDRNLMEQRFAAAADSANVVEFMSLYYVLHVAGYIHARNAGVQMHVVKYEDLLSHPLVEMKKLLNFCEVPASDDDLRLCLAAMEEDSQAGSKLGRQEDEQLIRREREDFAVKHAVEIEQIFGLFGLPKISCFDTVFEK